MQLFVLLPIFSAIAAVSSDITSHPVTSPANPWLFGTATGMSTTARKVVKKVLSVEQDEGVGARVRRSVGRPEVSSASDQPHPRVVIILFLFVVEELGSISATG